MNYALAVITGIVAGALAGMLGIGGGLIMIPAMVLLLGQSQHTAQGVSLVVMVFAALVGSSVHYRNHNVKMDTALWIAPVAAGFSFLGAWATGLISSEWMTRAFAIFVMVMGLRMLVISRGGKNVKAD